MSPRERFSTLRKAAVPQLRWPGWTDLGSWGLALITALGLWLFVNSGERTTERTLRVKVDFQNLPSGMVITSAVTSHVEVRVNGSGIILSSIDKKRLRTALDLAGVRPGVSTFRLGPASFQLPRKVEVLRVTPDQVSITIDRLSRRELPVRLQQSGEVPKGLRLRGVDLTPAKVAVRGPANRLDNLRSIDSESLDLTRLEAGPLETELKLVPPGEALELEISQVQLRAEVEQLFAERRIDRVPVAVVDPGRSWRVTPDRVTVVVRGPVSELHRMQLQPGSVHVEAAEISTTGSSRIRPVVDLPPGFDLVAVEPHEVSLQPVGSRRRGIPTGPSATGRQ